MGLHVGVAVARIVLTHRHAHRAAGLLAGVDLTIKALPLRVAAARSRAALGVADLPLFCLGADHVIIVVGPDLAVVGGLRPAYGQ